MYINIELVVNPNQIKSRYLDHYSYRDEKIDVG